jgi:hypothetical protein
MLLISHPPAFSTDNKAPSQDTPNADASDSSRVDFGAAKIRSRCYMSIVSAAAGCGAQQEQQQQQHALPQDVLSTVAAAVSAPAVVCFICVHEPSSTARFFTIKFSETVESRSAQ